MMRKKQSVAKLLAMLGALTWTTRAIADPVCPLRAPGAGTVSGPLASARPRVGSQPETISFTSGLSRDEDGNPRAYHSGRATADEVDPGLDHICNGMSVLEFSNGELRNKYAEGGSGGSLTAGTPDQRRAHSHACKHDFVALRIAEFPACGPGRLCGFFFGIATVPRACGFRRGRRDADDMGCGVPILQQMAAGQTLGFYMTTNTLTRPGSRPPLVQSDYADALIVPFIVMPGGQSLPTNAQWQSGDLAVVVWHGRVGYAVVGDSGPPGQIGEASRALLGQLGTSAVEDDDPATTLLFPGTAQRILARPWPLTPEVIREEVRRALGAVPGGIAALRTCPGLSGLN